MVYFIILDTNGDISEENLPLESKDKQKEFSKLIKSKKVKDVILSKLQTTGTGKLSELTKWKLNDSNKLIYYGFLKGKVENNHEIPYDESDDKEKPKVFGDIILFKTNKNEQVLDINTETYESLYNSIFYNNYSDNENENINESDDEDSDIEIIGKPKKNDDVEIDDFLEDEDVDEDQDLENLNENSEEDEDNELNQDYGNDLSDEEEDYNYKQNIDITDDNE